MPPIVERGRGNHRNGAPGTDECTERSVESPHGNGVGADGRIFAEGGGKNEVAAAAPRENAAELNQEMRGSPEGVAADALVPGNVPDTADRAASYGEDVAPDVPGDRKSFGGDALGCAGLERCG